MRAGVIVFPGSNCDRDVIIALKTISNSKPKILWHKETEIPNLDLVVIPGGFSYGDYLRCGAIARFAPVLQALKEFVKRCVISQGKPQATRIKTVYMESKTCCKSLIY